jgi:hypothetical protein
MCSERKPFTRFQILTVGRLAAESDSVPLIRQFCAPRCAPVGSGDLIQ